MICTIHTFSNINRAGKKVIHPKKSLSHWPVNARQGFCGEDLYHFPPTLITIFLPLNSISRHIRSQGCPKKTFNSIQLKHLNASSWDLITFSVVSTSKTISLWLVYLIFWQFLHRFADEPQHLIPYTELLDKSDIGCSQWIYFFFENRAKQRKRRRSTRLKLNPNATMSFNLPAVPWIIAVH